MKKQIKTKKQSSPDIPQSDIDILKSGLHQPFWQILRRIIQANVDYLGDQVNDDEELSDRQRNLLRKWRKLNKELLELPEKLITDMEEGIVESQDFSVYHETIESIKKDNLPN